MSNYRFKIGDFALTQAGLSKISGRSGRPTNYSPSQKTRINVLSYDIKIYKHLSYVLSQCTRLTYGRTDRQTEFSSLDRVCIPCSAVKSLTTLVNKIVKKILRFLKERELGPVASGLLQRVLACLPASTLAPFQRVLHAAERTILDLKPRDRVTPALQELHWLPVAKRIQYNLCLLVHKSLLGQTPEYISDLLISVTNIPRRFTLRSSSCGNLVVPRTRRLIGDKVFSVAAPRACNKLSS